MDYSKEYIKRIGGGELRDSEISQALIAIEGFVKLFGKSWVDQYFRWDEHCNSLRELMPQQQIEECFKVYSLPILHLILHWDDWCLVREKNGSEKITDRWGKIKCRIGRE